VKHGVPWDQAFAMTNNSRAAMLIIFAELNGAQFDWNSGQWVEK